MAREGRQARILADIWRDEDWRAMTPLAQWLYELLLSQPDRSQCGVLPLQPNRWAKLAAGVTAEVIEEWLGDLEAARFVVVDRDTDEVLIRTFVRHDILASNNANVIVGMSRDIHKIHSTDLQRAVVVGLPADWEEHLPAGAHGRLDKGFLAMVDEVAQGPDGGPEDGRSNGRPDVRSNAERTPSEQSFERPSERRSNAVKGVKDHPTPFTDPPMRSDAPEPRLSPDALVDAAIDELTDQRVAKATAEGFTPNHPDRFRASERSKVTTAVGDDLAELVRHPSITDVGKLLEAWRSLVAERDLLGQARTFGTNRGLCPDVGREEFEDEAAAIYEQGSAAWSAAVAAFGATRRPPNLRVVGS